jgi:hypothetical protein
MDIYTIKETKNVARPEVDRTVEDRMKIVRHAVAKALKSSQSYTPYIETVKKALNLQTLENYNVSYKKNTSRLLKII